MSDKVTIQTVDSLQNQVSALSKINANFEALADKIDTLLSRDGDTPNQMESNLDMNSYRITNLPEPINSTEPVRKIDLDEAVLATIPEGGTPGLIDGDKGDITVSSSGTVWTIDNNSVSTSKIADTAVTTIKITDGAITEGKIASNAITTAKVLDSNITNAKLANMAQATVKGRPSAAGTGTSVDLTATELRTIIGNVDSGTAGLAPASGGGTTNFLRADGTWASPPSGGSITLAAAQATTSGTQFDFTGLPAGINELVVHFNGVSLSGTDQFLVQLGTSSGVETASYVSAGNALNTVGLGNFPTTSVAGFVIPTIGIVWAFNGQMFIRRMSGNTWNASLGGSGAAPGDFSVYYGGGIKTLAGTLDRVRLTRTGSSTFDAGAVSISYR
jgi:hypothetical protein